MNVNHISLLIRRQLKEQYKAYLIGGAVLFGLLSFMFLLVHKWRDSFAGAVQNGVFLIGLFISGGVFTASMFQELSVPAKGIWLLGIPATQAEKVVSAILLSAFAFLVAYLGIFYLVDMGYVLLTYRQYQNSPMDLFKNGFYTFLFTYFLFNGIMLLGSVYFSKHSFIKTILALIVGLVLLYHFNNFLMEIITGIASITSSAPLGGLQYGHLGENIYVTLPENSGIISDLFVRVLLPLAFWGITWLRFREKEI